jgi:serine/threonine protein kinase
VKGLVFGQAALPRLNSLLCLQPNNILLGRSGDFSTIQLADYGLSKLFVGTPFSATFTSVVGTRELLAPEIKICSNYSVASDVWSLGVTLFLAAAWPKLHFESATIRTLDEFEDLMRDPAKAADWRMTPIDGFPADFQDFIQVGVSHDIYKACLRICLVFTSAV